MLSDLEAIKAIDRLAFAWSRNPDVIALRPWIAAHCGLNPNAAGPLDPDAAVVAECERSRATVAALRDKADRLAALVRNLDGRNGELREQLAVARKEAKKERADRLQAAKPVDNDPDSPANKRKAKRNAYQRELMRKRRAEKAAKTSPADTADKSERAMLAWPPRAALARRPCPTR
jgi:hypothetical protein